MAKDVFWAQIAMDGRFSSSFEHLVLKLGVKLSTHETAWALLRPEEWTDVVRDGDEIRLGGFDVDPGPLIIFKHIMDCDAHKRDYICKYVTMLLPDKCVVSYVQIGRERLG